MRFFLGTHESHWLARADFELFVSHRRLLRHKRLPVARRPWALDSGGFTELNLYGEWRTGVTEYLEAVEKYQEGVGQMVWASPQDWMCEPFVTAKTGKSVQEHQELTVQNFLDLGASDPFIPVLQGWELDDYFRCVEMYANAGIDLTEWHTVGVGSVCRRQASGEIDRIIVELSQLGLNLHGFGVKKDGLERYGQYLTSADSMAWSYSARLNPTLPGCTHKTCSNCLRYADRWRAQAIKRASFQQERFAV